MKIVKLLLYPFAAMYNLGTKVRNYLYDIGQRPSFQFETPIISVGNLNVGGSGKTPMVEYLIHLLKDKYAVATLSRGYKRATKGYRLAHETDTASLIGDEPMQLLKKFGSDIKVVVSEDRVHAIPNILKASPQTDVIILDDALQHRSVRPMLSILVTEFSRPFYRDFLMPLGRLRESRRGSRRADIIVVTKCKSGLSEAERKEMMESIQDYSGQKPVFFATIEYGEPLPIGNQKILVRNIILVSGIAKTNPLTNYCNDHFRVLKHFNYPDHHRYTTRDLEEIEKFCAQQRDAYSIITTEKDMVKLIEPGLKPYVDRLPWFYIPIRQEFLEDGLKFDSLIFGILNPASE